MGFRACVVCRIQSGDSRAIGMIGTEDVVVKCMADEMCINSVGFCLEMSVCDFFRNEVHIQQDSYK